MTRERALGLLGFVGGEPTSDELEMLYSRKNRELAERLRTARSPQIKEKIISMRENLAEALAVLTGQPLPERESPNDEPPPGALGDETPVPPPAPVQAKKAPASQKPAASLIDVTNLLPEQVLNHRYQIRRRIGHGSVGIVYVAFDTTRQEEIAIKVIQPQLLVHPEARNRFLAEAKNALRMNHPNIAKSYDVQKLEDESTYFITMELLKGHSLRQHMTDRRHFSVDDVKSAARTIAAALGVVHQLTVHGDLKPENVWVDHLGTLKLMDIGIARLLDRVQMSLTARMLGRAAYLAPEQHRDDLLLDQRADQYGLSAILYEMLTGKPPGFDVVPPPASVRGDVPKGMSRAIMRAMSQNPDARFADVQDFVVELTAPSRGAPWKVLTGLAAVGLIAAGAVITSDDWLPTARQMLAREHHDEETHIDDIPDDIKFRASLPPGLATQPVVPLDTQAEPKVEKPPAKPAASDSSLAATSAQEHFNAALKNLRELSSRPLVMSHSAPAEELTAIVTAAEQVLMTRHADKANTAMKQGGVQLLSGNKVASDDAFEQARSLYNEAASGAIGAAAMAEAWATARSSELAAQERIKARNADALAGLTLFREGEKRRQAGEFSAAQAAYQNATGRWQTMSQVSGQSQEKATALFEQGRRALFGEGVPQSDTEAARLLSEAANEGSIEAIPYLADLLLEGRGTNVDADRAAALLRRAVEAGNIPATARLGKLYLSGQGVVADTGEGLRLVRLAAEHDAGAMGMLGVIYAEGKIVTRDDAQAMKLLTSAVERDSRPAGETMHWLGLLYRDGRGANANREQAERWLSRAAEANYAPSMIAMGDLHAAGETPDGAKAVSWYARAADAPSAAPEVKRDAAFRAAEAYENGLVGDPDPAKAREWYQKAAELNDTRAMRRLAAMYRNGMLGNVDAAQARQWVEKAALAGDADAMVDLAQMSEQGIGAPKDANAAMKFYRRAADAGHVTAMVLLADRLSAGAPAGAIPAEALSFYEKAGNAGSARAAVRMAQSRLSAGDAPGARQWLSKAENEPEAMYMIGEMYSRGTGTAPDPKQASQWYRRAADAGHRVAMRSLANTMQTTDPAEAVRWYRNAAELGDPVAMTELALRMQWGQGVRADSAGAVRWLKRAADVGNPDAMYHLARTYEMGEGVTKDPHKAQSWAESAAKAGQVDAMVMLGQIFYNGTTGARDYARAAGWYRSAAEKGNPSAMYTIAKMYYDGMGVNRDRDAATKWMRQAAKAGEEDAAAKLRAWGMAE